MIAGTIDRELQVHWMYRLNPVNAKSYVLMASGRIGNPAYFVNKFIVWVYIHLLFFKDLWNLICRGTK